MEQSSIKAEILSRFNLLKEHLPVYAIERFSRLRFEMSLGLMGYPFVISENESWRKECLTPIISIDEYDTFEHKQYVDELFLNL